MPTRVDVLRSIAGQLFPMREGPTKKGGDVDLHLLSVIVLLCTRGDVLADVYPVGKATNPDALYKLGVDQKRATPEMIDSLRESREVFAGAQVAWLNLSGYTDPPCPPNTAAQKLVAFTVNLPNK
jgi:hypothetical protein